MSFPAWKIAKQSPNQDVFYHASIYTYQEDILKHLGEKLFSILLIAKSL